MREGKQEAVPAWEKESGFQLGLVPWAAGGGTIHPRQEGHGRPGRGCVRKVGAFLSGC